METIKLSKDSEYAYAYGKCEACGREIECGDCLYCGDHEE